MANKLKGGRKLARTSKDKGYYERQNLVTARNKLRRATKRANKRAHWALIKEQAKAHE